MVTTYKPKGRRREAEEERGGGKGSLLLQQYLQCLTCASPGEERERVGEGGGAER